MIYQKASPYFESAKKYKELQRIHEDTSHNAIDTTISKFTKINRDYVGWIKIQDTRINYPVVKTDNNSFYLKHNFYRNQDIVGSIFMDYRNSVNKVDKNIIVYGHNMNDSSMFGSLKKFKDPKYLDQHDIISFQFLGSTYEWMIFSVYTARDTEWMKTGFLTMNEFADYLSAVKKRSIINRETNVTNDDTLLTLSTCTNREKDERIIVHAKLISKGKGLKNES